MEQYHIRQINGTYKVVPRTKKTTETFYTKSRCYVWNNSTQNWSWCKKIRDSDYFRYLNQEANGKE